MATMGAAGSVAGGGAMVIGGTLAEDAVTGGAGVVDDPATIGAGLAAIGGGMSAIGGGTNTDALSIAGGIASIA